MNIWAIQSNIIYQPDFQSMISALDQLGYPWIDFKAFPFTDLLPKIRSPGYDSSKTIYYGSTNVISALHQSELNTPGIFQNDNFDFRIWKDEYRILNSTHQIVPFRDITKHHFYGTDGEHAFIRPVLDLKEFAGEVIDWCDFARWKDSLYDIEHLLLDCECVVALPVGISTEYRCILVDGKVVSSSKYRLYHRLETDANTPLEIIRFAEDQAKNWSPHPVFVMDVAVSGGKPWVLEIGCFNSVGFYKCNLNDTFKAVQQYMEKINRERRKTNDGEF